MKKSSSKKSGKFIKDAPAEKFFVLCNGQRIRNIKELAMVIDKVDDGVFFYHVTPEKNDFSNWIKDVFKEAKLARSIYDLKDKNELRKKLYAYFGESC